VALPVGRIHNRAVKVPVVPVAPACKGVPDTALFAWVVAPSQLVCEVAPVLHSSTLKPLFLVKTELAPSEIVTTAASPSYWPAELNMACV
jgi:hypothetical protein